MTALQGRQASAAEASACEILWAFPVSEQNRSELEDACRNRSERKQFLNEVLAADPKRGLSWFFQVARDDFVQATWLVPPTDRWWEVLKANEGLSQNIDEDLDAPEHPLRRLFKSRKFREWVALQSHENIDASEFDYVTLLVRPNEQVFLLPEGTAIPIRLEASPPRAHNALYYLAVRKSQTATVAVYPLNSHPGHQAPPLLYNLRASIAPKGDGYLLDTTSDRRMVHVYAEVSDEDAIALDGYKLPLPPRHLMNLSELPPTFTPSPHRLDDSFEVRLQAAPPRLVVGRQGHILDTELGESIALNWKADGDEKTALLRPTTRGCESEGLDESQVRSAVKSQLGDWQVEAEDLGQQGEMIKAYVEAAGSAAGLPTPPLELSRGRLGVAEQLSAQYHSLFNKGFRHLLDVRVSCSRTPKGEDVFAMTAMRASVASSRKDLVSEADLEGFDRPETIVISDVSQLSDALSLVLARAWRDKPAMLVRASDGDAPAIDGVEARLEVTQAARTVIARRAIPVATTSAIGIGTDRDLCDQIRDSNRLRGETKLDTVVGNWIKRHRQDPQETPVKEDALDTWRSFPVPIEPFKWLGGNEYYLVKASVTGSRSAYRCVHALPTKVVFAADVFPSFALWSTTRNSQQLPEHRADWLALGYVGPANGLGVALGASHRLSTGIGASSWADTANVTSASVSGAIPYQVDTFSFYIGANWTLHKDLWSCKQRQHDIE
jgi:hypothetical protein